MSYTINQSDSAFFILEENMTSALSALKKLCEERNWCGGLKKVRHLENALDQFGWSLEFDDDGNVSSIEFLRDYEDCEQELFSTLAPFIRAESFIEMIGEDNKIWRWVFDGTTCQCRKPTIVW